MRQNAFNLNTSSAELTPHHMKYWMKLLEILKSNPEIKVTIEGHSSSDGTYEVKT